MAEEKKEYTEIKCNGCGEVIRFVVAKTKDGRIKNVPVNVEAVFILCSSGEQDEKGKYIYNYKKGYVSHFSTCPNAEDFRNKSENKAAEEAPAAADGDKPPF